jgi:hypothetical protein
MCGVVTSLLDAWICAREDEVEGKAVGHSVMGVIVVVVDVAMVWA